MASTKIFSRGYVLTVNAQEPTKRQSTLFHVRGSIPRIQIQAIARSYNTPQMTWSLLPLCSSVFQAPTLSVVTRSSGGRCRGGSLILALLK